MDDRGISKEVDRRWEELLHLEEITNKEEN